MKTNFTHILIFFLFISQVSIAQQRNHISKESNPDNAGMLKSEKQRLIVTTDIGGTDPDDEQSMVHLLVTANEFDIEGIICGLAWMDDKHGINALNTIVESYREVLPNLNIHSKGYPTYEYIKGIIKTGQIKSKMAGVGEGKDTPGSELIIAAVDKKDDLRPVWLNAWGGANTIAQALWKVKNTRTPRQVDAFINKIRIYDVLGQDDAGAWIAKTFPNLIYIRNKSVYGWAPSDEWVKKNVQSQGSLGAKYRDRIWAVEGDSPAFLYLYPNGLSNPDAIDQGNWGGRFDRTKVANIRSMDIAVKSGIDETKYDPYLMYTNTTEGSNAINRWKQEIWNNLANRMKWSVTSTYANANHNPVACINDDCTKQVLTYSAKAGSELKLNANKSSDPDGNELIYNWFFYKEPSSYKGSVTILNNKAISPVIVIPQDSARQTIHIIMQLSDNAESGLTSYRRVIIKVD